jgi:acetyl esterase/lipase
MQTPRARRRAVLAASAAAPLVACGGPGERVEDKTVSDSSPSERLTYGPDPSQWVDVRSPQGASRGLVVVVHGGFWKAQYGAEYGEPLAKDLAGRGWTTANVEYRRVGNGGGFPETLDDVHAALGALPDHAAGPIVTLGHSAGGHLATWAAGRGRFERWSGGPEITHVVSQAGVLDLRAAVAEGLGGGAALAFLGDDDPDAATYEQADPLSQVPLAVPVWAVHAPDDVNVPFSQAVDYVAAATAAGGEATLVEVTGGHFDVIEPGSDAWAAVVAVLDDIA